MIPVSRFAVTGAYAVRLKLEAWGVRLVTAGRMTEITEHLRRARIYADEIRQRMSPTLRQALRAFRERFGTAATSRSG